ncbi:MAG TPA: Gfo/Idh/MocA family oxidoreductase [Thermoanaerobaculia bacterium]|nr:Gfo/Idh/MocA family oxidoreductase [Thermoanaerobaculia bacterium]
MSAVAESGLAEIAYTCDVDTELSFDDLLASDADAIVIATPSAMHAEQAVAVLERGKAVFCQKPLGRNARETRRVVDAARANDRLLGVDLSYRHTEAMQAVRRLVVEKTIGDVYAVELLFHNAYGPDKPWFYERRQSGGGCVIDLGIHLADLALWTLGFPRVGRVSAQLRHHGGHDVEDYASALFELSNGAAVQLACSWNLSAGRECVIGATFYGTRGAAAFRNVNGSFYDFVAEHHQKTGTTRLTEPGDPWGGKAIIAWAGRLAGSRAFDPEIEHVVEVAETLDAIYEAAR